MLGFNALGNIRKLVKWQTGIVKLEGVLCHCEEEQIKNNASFKYLTKRLDKLQYLGLVNLITLSLHVDSGLTSASHLSLEGQADFSGFKWT